MKEIKIIKRELEKLKKRDIILDIVDVSDNEAFSEVRAVCPYFDVCFNKLKDEHCDDQLVNEMYCLVLGQVV